MILQAVENKNIIASDDYLNQLFETIREGVLNCKILIKDGKRSNDRSWRPAWAVLKSNGALFLCKEKKDNIMIPSVDSYPINLKNCDINIAYDYNKRKNVFKLNTINNYEFLFQTIDNKSMSEWIRALQVYSRAQDQGPSSSSLVSTDSSASSSMRRLESPVSPPLNKFSTGISKASPTNSRETNVSNVSNELISSPDDLFYPNYDHQSMKKGVVGEDMSPRRDVNNRKWVRQMTKRIKGFVTSNSLVGDFENSTSSSLSQNQNELTNSETSSNRLPYTNKNFGLPLEKCEPSSASFVNFI